MNAYVAENPELLIAFFQLSFCIRSVKKITKPDPPNFSPVTTFAAISWAIVVM